MGEQVYNSLLVYIIFNQLMDNYGALVLKYINCHKIVIKLALPIIHRNIPIEFSKELCLWLLFMLF